MVKQLRWLTEQLALSHGASGRNHGSPAANGAIAPAVAPLSAEVAAAQLLVVRCLVALPLLPRGALVERVSATIAWEPV